MSWAVVVSSCCWGLCQDHWRRRMRCCLDDAWMCLVSGQSPLDIYLLSNHGFVKRPGQECMQEAHSTRASVSNSTTTTTASQLGGLQLKTFQGRSQSTTTTSNNISGSWALVYAQQSQLFTNTLCSYHHVVIVTASIRRPAGSTMSVHLSSWMESHKKIFPWVLFRPLSIIVNKFIMKTYLHNQGPVIT